MFYFGFNILEHISWVNIIAFENSLVIKIPMRYSIWRIIKNLQKSWMISESLQVLCFTNILWNFAVVDRMIIVTILYFFKTMMNAKGNYAFGSKELKNNNGKIYRRIIKGRLKIIK